jgi:hypothetical protein
MITQHDEYYIIKVQPSASGKGFEASAWIDGAQVSPVFFSTNYDSAFISAADYMKGKPPIEHESVPDNYNAVQSWLS